MAAAVLLTLIMVALILKRWLTVREPTSLLRVQGSEASAGVVVTVSSMGSKPRETKLGPENQYTANFHLPSGTYTLSASRHGQPFFQAPPVLLREGNGLMFDLTSVAIPPPDATRPSR